MVRYKMDPGVTVEETEENDEHRANLIIWEVEIIFILG
jgi:hypothetical protein